MRTIIFKKLIRLSLHIVVIAALFMLMIFLFENKNTMILTMSSNSSHPLNVEVYYTKAGVAFDDNKVSHKDKVKGNKYYFTLPRFNEIQYTRLDPARHKRDITIQKDIQIIASRWFTTTLYTADITKSVVVQQIDDYTVHKDGISFKTTGKDPQLNINLTRTVQHTFRNLHFDTFIMSILIYLVLLFLYKIYKTEKPSEMLTAKLILYTLFLAFSIFKVDYYKDNVSANYIPDGIAHLSYISYIHDTHEVLPKFENMYMITNKNAGNYLGHPPLYYYLMNTVYNKYYSVVGNIDNFRMLNIMIFIASILLLLYIGYQAEISLLAHFVYLTFITSLPMHAYLGSGVTNDNLAIFGGLLFAVGLLRLIQKHYTNSTYFIIGLGIFIAFFSKFTAALLIFFAGIFFIVYWIRYKVDVKITITYLFILTLFIVPVLAYQVHIWLDYHAIVPTLRVTHPEEYKHSVYYIPEALRDYKTPLEWLKVYWHYIHTGWFGIHSHYSFTKLSISGFMGLFILHVFALITLFLTCKKENHSFCLLGKIGLIALLTVAIVQVSFSYHAHLNSGYMGGLQPRYLLPFMFSLAIMASIFVDRFSKSFLFTLLIIFICIQALYSDFFYFLKYYA